MKQLPLFLVVLVAAGMFSTPAWAQEVNGPSVRRVAASFMPVDGLSSTQSSTARALIDLRPSPLRVADVLPGATADAAQAPPVAFEYSDAYHARARIHRIASFATLPLFVTEGFLGESLYNSPTEGKKSAHLVIGGAIFGLFAVNTVTGVWNLVEARKDPNGSTRRWVHGILMLAADAGFLATMMTGPGGQHGRFPTQQVSTSAGTHRAIAFSSISLATAGYLTMLIGGH
jgi:hypothetical protein